MMGTGDATGDRRAYRAAEQAITNPLLDEVSLKGARNVLLSIIGGNDMTLYEVDEAASRVREEVDPEANIIVGATFDDQLGGSIRVAIVASGLNGAVGQGSAPASGPTVPPALPRHATAGVPPSPVSPPRPMTSAGPSAGPGEYVAPRATRGTPAPAGAHRPEPPRELWRGPGNVVIEETRPASAQRPVSDESRSSPPEPPPFRPAAPEQLGRPSTRRVPDLEDFPPVGQREYRAKAGQAAPPPRQRGSEPDLPRESHESAPRSSLLQRMMGSARKTIRQ
jgi:cell division protein FtsZ